jgi:NAD(P)-dependent dehydrogenase (short-subunit alcohol dehydrogenase family)
MTIGSTSAHPRVAVVTGASRGLGRAIARHLAVAGHDIVIGFRSSPDAAKGLVEELGGLGRTALMVAGDQRDEETSTALVAAARELGPLDVWVNNAGVSVLAPLIDTTPTELEEQHQVNVMGTFHGLRAAAHELIGSARPGRIINIASEAGLQAFPLLGAYSATKFAVVGLTQAAAIELAPHGITVNAVCPGTAETDMVAAERARESTLTGDPVDVVRSRLLGTIPLGRHCEPDDVGALVAFVASPAASYLTGQALCTNGGSVLH